MKKTTIGIIGCGKISDIYLTNLSGMFPNTTVAAVADIVAERAEAKAKQYNIPRACKPEELIADDSIEIVLNITIPAVHGEIAIEAVRAGKHVYNEKPLTVSRKDARRLLDEARKKNVRVGCAPDTFLGAGLQTARNAIDRGIIGRPVAATAFMLSHGPEGWHPDPEFFYRIGGGPMFDMGPYYLTTLVNLVGPVAGVTGIARKSFEERTIGSEPKKGKKIKVEIPTHVVGVLDFSNGAVGTIITSFDVWAHNLPRIEIYGTLGTLSVPDPNTFGGDVRAKAAGKESWETIPHTHSHAENSRGIGLSDMAAAIEKGEPHRANGDLANHVLDIMHTIHDASAAGRYVKLASTCERPAPLPADA